MRSMLFLLLPLLTIAGPAFADDGVAEINHTCAVQTGCFGGDLAGYPVTIDGTAGTSYRLTSDLRVPDEDSVGILVGTSTIGIDLNGFSIIRAACVGVFFACTPAQGSGGGIVTSSLQNRGLAVSNGSVVGTGGSGVQLGGQAEVIRVESRWNRLAGISAGDGSILLDNRVYENGSDGLFAGVGSVVSRNTAFSNGQRGIAAGTGSVLRENASYGNSLSGLGASSGSVVAGNTAYDNTGDGITSGTGCVLLQNSSVTNGDDAFVIGLGSVVARNTASFNAGDGIETSGGSNVQRNTLHSNAATGLRLQSDDGFRDNVMTSNDTGVSSGVNLFGNSCDGAASCP